MLLPGVVGGRGKVSGHARTSLARERAVSWTWNGGEDVGAAISVLDGDLDSQTDAQWKGSRALGEPDMCTPAPPNANHPIHHVCSTFNPPPMRSEYDLKPSHSQSPVPPLGRLSPIVPRDNGLPTPPQTKSLWLTPFPFRRNSMSATHPSMMRRPSPRPSWKIPKMSLARF